MEHAASNQCQVSMTPISADYVAAWLTGLGEDDEVEFPQSGHSAISLPPKLKGEISKAASSKRQSKRDWLVQHLEECVRDDQSPPSMTDHAKRAAELEERDGRNTIHSE